MSFICTQLNVKTVLFQTMEINISTQFSSIKPIDRALSSATTPDQRGPGSDGNVGVLDCLVLCPGYSLGRGRTPL